MRRIAFALALVATMGCAKRGPRSPERVRDAYGEALAKDDPAAAYALLEPGLRAKIPYKEFEARWKQNKGERKAARDAVRKVPEGSKAAVRGGTTVHSGGRVLTWTEAGGRYYVVDGLPGTASSATPAQAIRSLIAAVRTTDLSRVRALLGEDLATAIDEDWESRVEALQAALDRPGAIELSADMRRAELRYEAGRVLTLEQTPEGWRITKLE